MSPNTKKLPRGKSGKITDDAIENALMSIVANSSTTAWSMRTHVIRSDRIIKTKNNVLERDNDKKVNIPAFHRKISKSEMFYHYCTKYPNVDNHLKRSAFFALTKTVTITEDKSMRAIDYNITDLLHEQQKRLSVLIIDVFQIDFKEQCCKLLKLLNEIYSIVQHQYPQVVSTTSKKHHNISFAIGNPNVEVEAGTCNYCDLICQFFKENLPQAIDGSLGKFYADIIENSFQKVLLYMGHSLRCKAQNIRIKQLQQRSQGDTIVLIMDYMMKFEEFRQRESSRDHYGKRGLVVHGGLVKYKLTDGKEIKRIYYTVPEGDGTQDSKAALATLDVLCRAIKDDSYLAPVKN